MYALQEPGKQFNLMTYPAGKRVLPDPASQKQVFHAIADFIDRYLK